MQPASHSQRFPPIGWLGLLLWSLLLLLPGLTSLPPLDRDEPRFAQASKQMLTCTDGARLNKQMAINTAVAIAPVFIADALYCPARRQTLH